MHKSARVMTVLNKTKHCETQPRQSPHLHQRQSTPLFKGRFFLAFNYLDKPYIMEWKEGIV